MFHITNLTKTGVVISGILSCINSNIGSTVATSSFNSLFDKPHNLLEERLISENQLNPNHLTGLQNIDGNFYYFNDDGSLHTGWQKFGKNTVYYKDSGNFTKGLVNLLDDDGNEGIYYFDDNGLMTTGWKTINGKKYFFNKDGKAQTSDMKDGETTYSFDKNGVMTGSHKEEKIENNTDADSGSNNEVSSYQTVSYNNENSSVAQPATQPQPVNDGAVGTISIGGYSARGEDNSVNQPIVDAPNSAVLMNYMGRQIIADHAYQGFSVLRSCYPGTTGYLCGNTITCVSTYQGTNTGYGILLDDGRYADEVYDGAYIMYTCNDATGVSVTVTFWN